MARLEEQLRASVRARQRVRSEALRTLKAALWGATSEAELRTRLGRYRARCVEQLELYVRLGSAAEGVADRLVEDVGVCDALLPRLTGVELEQLVTALAKTPGTTERIIGEVMRAAPGQVDGVQVRALVTAARRAS